LSTGAGISPGAGTPINGGWGLLVPIGAGVGRMKSPMGLKLVPPHGSIASPSFLLIE